MLLEFFFRRCWKNSLKNVLQNYQKNVLSSIHFKIFELSNPPSYNYRKTDSAANISFVSFENFKIGLRANFRFLKVGLKLTEKFPGSDLWWVRYQKLTNLQNAALSLVCFWNSWDKVIGLYSKFYGMFVSINL